MINLDHTIVPAHDKEASAKFFAHIFGCTYEGIHGPFAPVRISDATTLDFADRPEVPHHHYAFHVDDATFDDIFGRVKEEALAYGSGPRDTDNMQFNDRLGGRGFYFLDPNGHSYELMTRR